MEFSYKTKNFSFVFRKSQKNSRRFPKNSRIWKKTQCYGGKVPQVASKKSGKKQSCLNHISFVTFRQKKTSTSTLLVVLSFSSFWCRQSQQIEEHGQQSYWRKNEGQFILNSIVMQGLSDSRSLFSIFNQNWYYAILFAKSLWNSIVDWKEIT